MWSAESRMQHGHLVCTVYWYIELYMRLDSLCWLVSLSLQNGRGHPDALAYLVASVCFLPSLSTRRLLLVMSTKAYSPQDTGLAPGLLNAVLFMPNYSVSLRLTIRSF